MNPYIATAIHKNNFSAQVFQELPANAARNSISWHTAIG
jgi:hypothetical protein